MTDLSQTTGVCSDPHISRQTRLLHFDKHSVRRESVVGVQLTSWGDPQMVVAALDVGQPVLARYRHSRCFSVEHGQDSRMLNGTFPGHCGQNEILNNQSFFCLFLFDVSFVPTAPALLFLCWALLDYVFLHRHMQTDYTLGSQFVFLLIYCQQ